MEETEAASLPPATTAETAEAAMILSSATHATDPTEATEMAASVEDMLEEVVAEVTESTLAFADAVEGEEDTYDMEDSLGSQLGDGDADATSLSDGDEDTMMQEGGEELATETLMQALGTKHVEPPKIQGPRERHCWNAENEGAVLALYKAGLRPKAIKQRLKWNIPTVVVHNKITSLKRNGTITEREFPSHRRFSTRQTTPGTPGSGGEAAGGVPVAVSVTPPPSNTPVGHALDAAAATLAGEGEGRATHSGGISKNFAGMPQRRSRRAVKPVQMYSPQVPPNAMQAGAGQAMRPNALFAAPAAASASVSGSAMPQATHKAKGGPRSGLAGARGVAGGVVGGRGRGGGGAGAAKRVARDNSFETSMARQALLQESVGRRVDDLSSDESEEEGYESSDQERGVRREINKGMLEMKLALQEQQRQQWLHLCDLTQHSLQALATHHGEVVAKAQDAQVTTLTLHCKALQQQIEHQAEITARRFDALEKRIMTAIAVSSSSSSSASSKVAAKETVESAHQGASSSAMDVSGQPSGTIRRSASSLDQRLDFLVTLNSPAAAGGVRVPEASASSTSLS